MNNLNKYCAIVLVAGLLFLTSCSQPDGNSPGSEYMPDMGHSIAYEANYYDYYYFNTWGSEDEYYKMAQSRKPVQGTIPRGYTGVYYANSPKAQLAVMDHLDGKTSVNAAHVSFGGLTKGLQERRRIIREQGLQRGLSTMKAYIVTQDSKVFQKTFLILGLELCTSSLKHRMKSPQLQSDRHWKLLKTKQIYVPTD